jgi:hypothetical protein
MASNRTASAKIGKIHAFRISEALKHHFAELVAWHEALRQHHGDLIIEVNDARGKTLRQWEPLTFPGVQKRFADIDELLASPESCRNAT